MSARSTDPTKPAVHLSPASQLRQRAIDFFAGYFWLVFKNVVGWILILTSPALGIVVPGPGGLPAFLIGFALVTFPGKRRLTSRVMSGRGLPLEMQIFTFVTAFFAIITTCILMWILSSRVYKLLSVEVVDIPARQNATYAATFVWLIVTGLFALGATWLVMRLALRVVNYVLRGAPIIRRKIRPWLRKKGFNLLPARRKKVATAMAAADSDEEILEIAPRHHHRLRTIGAWALLWAKRALSVAITVAIFYFMLRPMHDQWPSVSGKILGMSRLNLLIAIGLFAIFLFLFRAMVWRKLLKDFGHTIPVAPAVRIWATSDLARYIPGTSLQFAARSYLARSYGVSQLACSGSHLLELILFLFANLLVTVLCVGCYGFREFHNGGNFWLAAVIIAIPLMITALHPRIFYTAINQILHRLGKPIIERAIPGAGLPVVMSWNVLGLILQTLALYMLMAEPLDLRVAWIWSLAGSYSIAWCAGFLAFWAPGGLGVRELVFIGMMRLIAPPEIQGEDFNALIAFLSLIARVWSFGGEVLLAAVAYTLDFRGAITLATTAGNLQPVKSLGSGNPVRSASSTTV